MLTLGERVMGQQRPKEYWVAGQTSIINHEKRKREDRGVTTPWTHSPKELLAMTLTAQIDKHPSADLSLSDFTNMQPQAKKIAEALQDCIGFEFHTLPPRQAQAESMKNSGWDCLGEDRFQTFSQQTVDQRVEINA
jgi:hypothetical protein